ncbi:MAG TPA: hypothetical protein PLU10_04240 [Chitinophagaceae bacterium]|nr:hypothetical protein [Chitinophagaceae bacterium]
MRRFLYLASLVLLMSACGSNPESDNVAYNPRNFQYNYMLNPSFAADTNIKQFSASLSFYSAMQGAVQLTLSLNGTQVGKTYQASIYREDTTQLNALNPVAEYDFPALLAIDSTEIIYSTNLNWDFDSAVKYIPRYVTVMFPDSSSVTNSNLLIKGKFGKP